MLTSQAQLPTTSANAAPLCRSRRNALLSRGWVGRACGGVEMAACCLVILWRKGVILTVGFARAFTPMVH